MRPECKKSVQVQMFSERRTESWIEPKETDSLTVMVKWIPSSFSKPIVKIEGGNIGHVGNINYLKD